jgi:hypothetical protein
MISPVSREFLLVHGMSHGGWAWEPLVRRRLSAPAALAGILTSI